LIEERLEMRFRWLLSSVLVVSAFAVMAACGGDDGEPMDEEARGLLEQAVLTVDDLPAGLQRASASFSTNKDVAEAQLNPGEELAKLERWGRRLGYDVAFELLPDAPPDLLIRGVQSTASLYDTSQGASESFADGVSSARAMDWEAGYPELTQLEVTEIDRPDIGDGVFWMRASGFQSLQQGEALLVDDQVALRVGSVRAFLRVVTVFEGGTDRTVYMDEVEQWARLVSERIAEVLGADAEA